MSAISGRPAATEFASFHAGYIGLVQEADIVAEMDEQLGELLTTLGPVSEAAASVLHPPYTWTFREVLGHITDAERIFGYRALCFIRGDQTPLPAFDENQYARDANYDAVALADWLSCFELVRRSNLWLFRHLPDDAWMRAGVAFGNATTVRAQAYIIVGHVRHHLNILKKRLQQV